MRRASSLPGSNYNAERGVSVKKLLLTGLLALFLGACGLGASFLPAAAETSVLAEDDFTRITAGETHAAALEGVAASADSTHGLIPSAEWGSPALIADESWLLYEFGDGAEALGGLYMSVAAKVWGQNDERAYAENAINVWVGTSPDAVTTLAKSYTAGENMTFEDGVDLTAYVEGATKAYVKVELVQSKADCGHEECRNGAHTQGCGTVATPDGYMDIWYFGVKLFKLTFSDGAPTPDVAQPVPNDFKANLPSEIFVSRQYTFPEIVFTDDVDGRVDYRLTMTDPYNITTDLGVNATDFLPEYEGIYTFEISASDAAGNTYVDKFSLSCVLAEGMPVIWFDDIPERSGRTGVEYTLEPLRYDESEDYDIEIYVLTPEGERIDPTDGKFTPEEVGEYRIIYSATNAEGTTKLFSRVYVKYNTNGGNVYEMVGDTEHWEGSVSPSGGGVSVEGDAYCKLPFSLAEGINLDLTLSPASGSWLGIYFTQYAGFGSFYFDKSDYAANGAAPGLYILVYHESTGYYCDIDYVGLTGGAMVVANHSSCGSGPELRLALKQNANGQDLIELFINGTRNENYELNYSVFASVIADNEGYSYLGFGNLLNGGAALGGVDIYDSTPPEIVLGGEWPETAAPGSSLVLPAVSAVDAHDGEMSFTAELYSPDGRRTEVADGSVVLGVEGVWYYIVSARDLSGNETYAVFEIGVGNTNKTTYFAPPSGSVSREAVIAGAVGGIVVVLAAAFVVCLLRIRKEEV